MRREKRECVKKCKKCKVAKARRCAFTIFLLLPSPPWPTKPKRFSMQQKVATDSHHLIIPRDPFPSVSVLSLADTYTSCSSPPPPPPVFDASSSHLLLLLTARVPNEAPWECSLAPSLKIDLFAFCCFWGAAGTDCLLCVPYGLAAPAFMQQTHTQTNTKTHSQASDHTLAFLMHMLLKLTCTLLHALMERMNICVRSMMYTRLNKDKEDGRMHQDPPQAQSVTETSLVVSSLAV